MVNKFPEEKEKGKSNCGEDYDLWKGPGVEGSPRATAATLQQVPFSVDRQQAAWQACLSAACTRWCALSYTAGRLLIFLQLEKGVRQTGQGCIHLSQHGLLSYSFAALLLEAAASILVLPTAAHLEEGHLEET